MGDGVRVGECPFDGVIAVRDRYVLVDVAWMDHVVSSWRHGHLDFLAGRGQLRF